MRIKKGKRLVSTALICTIGLSGFSQEKETLTFEEILNQKKSEWKARNYNEEKVNKETGKFIKHWNSNLNEDGTLGEMTRAFGGSSKSASLVCSESPGDWEIVGPYVYDGPSLYDWQVGLYHKQWNGLMSEVYVAEDQSYILAASEKAGLWRRATGETGWTNVTFDLEEPYLSFNSIEASPYDQNTLFASSGGDYGAKGILTSTDGGITWTELTGFQTDYCAEFPSHCAGGNESFINTYNLYIDHYNSTGPSNIHIYVFTEQHGHALIWKSTNSGANWTRLDAPGLPYPAPSLPVHYVWSDLEVDEDGNLYCVTVQKYTANADYWKFEPGIGWTDLTANLVDPVPTLSIKFSTPVGDKIFALRDDIERSIFVSEDKGVNWSHVISIPAVGSGWGGVKGTNEFQYIEEINQVFVGGCRLWKIDPDTPLLSGVPQGHVDVRDIYFVGSPGDYKLYTANDGGISRVNLNDNTYDDLSGDFLPVLQFSDIGTANMSEERYIGGVGHNHAKVLNNGTWKQFSGGDGDAAVIHPTNPDLAYVVTSNGKVYRYDMIAESNTSLSVSTTNVGGGWFNAHIDIHPGSPYLMYYTNDKGSDGVNRVGVYNEITDLWSYQELLPGMIRPGEIAMSKSSPERIYIADFAASDETNLDGLIRSDSWGATGSWTSIGATPVYDATGTILLTQLNELLGYKAITDIEVNPYNKDHLWITISGFMKEDEKERVLVSYDGGDSWREFSQGLPRYPVHSIVYIPATNGLMFVGTEAGIYYRDNAMSEWTCFNNNMPFTKITDLDYNTCSGKLVAATYGYGIWKSDLPTDESPLVYTTNTTLPIGNHEINTDVVIKAPAIFTVLGTLEMAAGRKITVEPGATLIVDGGKITNQCDYLWKGLFLGGHSDQPQLNDSYITDPNQATLILKNEGTIEHAEGVTTQAYHAGFTHGARIFSTNGRFIDNKNSVIMLSYENDNVSYFRNTAFLTTGPLGDPDEVDVHGRELGTRTHVGMWEISGVEFSRNRFLNTGTFDADIRGTGILSLDSDCDVRGICSSIFFDGTCADMGITFENLTTGIDFRSTTNGHKLFVKHNRFESTIQGITLTGGRDIEILDNMFYNYAGSDDDTHPIYTLKSWGIYLSLTNGATIKDNDFRDSDSNSPVDLNYYTRGIITRHTGSTLTSINRNTFESGEMIGIHAWHNNSGVQTTCNKFYSEYGIYVDRPDIGVSVFPTQGTPDEPVANRFFNTCSDQEKHFFFDGIDPISPWHTILDYHTVYGGAYVPTCFSSDWNTLSYFNISNPAPGYVNRFLQLPVSGRECGEAFVERSRRMIRNDEREETLSMEFELILESYEDQNMILEELERNNWLSIDESGSVHPAGKYLELTELRRTAITNAQLASLEIQEKSSLPVGEDLLTILADGDEWTYMTYLNQCAALKQTPEVFPHQLEEDYTDFLQLVGELKETTGSIHEISPDKKEKIAAMANQSTIAGTKAQALLAFIDEASFFPEVDEIVQEYTTPNQQTTEEVSDLYDFTVFPNPARGVASIQFDTSMENIQFRIFDLSGKEIIFNAEQISDSQYNVDLSHIASGTYFIQVTGNNHSITKTLLVKH